MPPYAAGLSGRDGDTGWPTRPPPHRLVADDEVFVAKLLSGLSRRFQGPTRRTRADFVFWLGRRGTVSSRRRRGARMRAAADLGQRNRRRARALIARR